ncbi:MAG TPA: hypothetical protein VH144_02020 [Candidatus Saccharimonadales bacterium]|nr:hypothetical protein [Candidatus Saccharimonadales bacterium]
MNPVAGDDELERLKAAQDLAFNRQKAAWQAQDDAWKKRSHAREVMNRAYEARGPAYAAQEASRQCYQQVRSHNGPRIDQLNAQQENAFQAMGYAFDNASAAHARRDGLSARNYADEGRRLQTEAKSCTAQRRQLVEEIRTARAQYESTKPAFQHAKAEFDRAKAEFNHAKADHEQKQAEFKRLKAEFESTKQAFRSRLEKVKAEGQRKRDDKRSIAQRAGVPSQHLDNVWVSRAADGTTNIYFGGVGKPNGPGHGHYAMDSSGNVTYRRDPFDPHGAQNFQRNPEVERRLATIAMDAFHRDRSSTGPNRVQYDDGAIKVIVRSGFHRDSGTVITDIKIIDRQNSPDEHLHMGINEHDGSILFQEWNKNH